MENITDTQIFQGLRQNIGTGLTQELVDITNIAIDAQRDEVISILNISNRAYNLTPEVLKKIYPSANTTAVQYIMKHAPAYGINTKKQMASFLATCIIESNGFNAKRENMNYRAQTLVRVFSRRLIPNLNFAQNLVAKGQVEIANHLYNGRMGNRPGTKDGWVYRGGGWIQLTGRANYYQIQNLTGIAFGDNPELIEVTENACIAAMEYWKLHGLNEQSERINVYANGWQLNTLNSRGVETNDYNMNTGIRLVRRTVNGGYNGLNEVAQTFEKAMKYL